MGFIGQHGLCELGQDIIRDVDRLQDPSEAFCHDFLAKIGQIAFAAITRAAVIRVLLLFELSGDRTFVIGTTEQA